MANSQLAIAWVMAQGSSMIPVIGSRQRTQIVEAWGALETKLSADDLVRIEQAVRPKPWRARATTSIR